MCVESQKPEPREKTIQVYVSWVRVLSRGTYDDNDMSANPSQEKGQMLGLVEAICTKGCEP